MRYLLDTNICIAIIHRPDPELVKKFSQCDPKDFALCSIVKAELIYGARKSQRITENLNVLETFFAPFESLPFDDRAAVFYGLNRAILEKSGTPIGGNDLLIASIALAHDTIVLTRNTGEFSRVPGIKVESW
jgi:tRNA(fMet)-specific endonuclease VapC